MTPLVRNHPKTQQRETHVAEKNTGTFSAIGKGDTPMFGATALLVAGYSVDEQKALRDLLVAHDLEHLPLVFIDAALQKRKLSDLAAHPDLSAEGRPSELRRAIVLSGLRETELHRLMKAYRLSGLPRQLWASMTPVSADWPMRTLLDELGKEKEDLRKAVLAQRAKNDSI
ncbi:MAG: hypothetical protein ACI856_001275 [Kiritimatiellia bacterium]|jgi:hypothetical protein